MNASSPIPPELVALHRELGIPPSYALNRGLPVQSEVAEEQLVELATNPDGRPVCLTAPAGEAWRAMQAAAATEGVELIPISGFRSVRRQAEIIRSSLAGGHGLDKILRFVAAPGFSEHHTGRALDIGCQGHLELEEGFEDTETFRWLKRRAGDFGFVMTYPRGNPHGIGYEPWHWCYRG